MTIEQLQTLILVFCMRNFNGHEARVQCIEKSVNCSIYKNGQVRPKKDVQACMKGTNK